MEDYKVIVKNYIKNELLNGENTNITETTSLIKGGIIDSIDIMRLITFLMEELNFELENDEYTLENFDSLGKIYAFLDKKCKYRNI
ncbi:acyl carrier protein [Acetivibrio clariflavus]|uniref:acyl carrier protein n=1 Tax=Acetivibrio clariflavus TaxID=288965 RepID=UPI00047F6469|nr:acyl carrier protein [Acetivibrio clariflavus]